MADVVLTSALRSNLQALQLTQSLIDSTQLRLSTGKKVNSALDNPQSYFAAQSLSNRSSDLSSLLDGIGQSISAVKLANTGTDSITKLVQQAQSIANNARAKAASGEIAASVTGTANLSGVTDFVSAGLTTGDTLTLSVVDDKNDLVRLEDENATPAAADTYQITFRPNGGIAHNNAGLEVSNINELVTAINGITKQSDGTKVFNASIDSNGQLKISSVSGTSYRAVFSAKRVADVLGLTKYTNNPEANGGQTLANASQYAFTASNKTTLSSLAFNDTNTSGVASRNTLLTDLRDETNTARVSGFADAADDVVVNVQLANGTAKKVTDLFGTGVASAKTVGDFIDAINANTTLNPYLKAGFDESTGQITLQSTSADVIGATLGVTDDNANAADVFNLGFGAFSNGTVGTSQVNINPTQNAAKYSETENILFAAGTGDLVDLKNQYTGLLKQIDDLVDDSNYAGTNLLKGDTLKTYFNEDRTSVLETTGASLKSGSLGLDDDIDFGTTASADKVIDTTNQALSIVRNFGSKLANDLSIIQTREDFTKGLVSTLSEGSDKLTLADQNEEGAKLLSLQTRQQLGVTALSLASQSQQAILRLF